jgi:hypothetical protein
MQEAFSFNREFDFVRLDRLSRTTGRPAHEWDVYILKELIDNALDADEVSWRNAPSQTPGLQVRVEYAAKQLFVEVSNRSVFPSNLIPEIFATQQYTSRKAFIKGLTRGALGNALKTLLGIPYALRNRVASDWSPDQKPLAIICGGYEYLPTYVVDTTQQTIEFKCRENPHKQKTGTTVRVALDYFEQEKPRTLAEIKLLAEQYRLCNPHVDFDWTVEVGEEEWSVQYEANTSWLTKFRGVAPIQWYSLTAFQDVLGALYRKQGADAAGLSIETIGSYFAGFQAAEADSSNAPTLMVNLLQDFGESSLAVEAFEGVPARKLYQQMCKLSPAFDSLQLGRIGKEHIRAMMTDALPVEGELFYEISRDVGDDPSIPFVVEAALVPLKEGTREIWTALNFSPTYDDPFLRRRLATPIQPDKTVLGLREFLDIYDIDEDIPVVLFFHLICPNIESGEFSKTEINHLPFKQVMGELLDRLLTSFTQAREEQELQLKQTIFKSLDGILEGLKENERFVFDQLLEKLRAKLSEDPILASWLETVDASDRLRSYITQYQSQNTVLTQRVARPTVGTLVLPVHPDRYFFVLAEHISQEILAKNHVNKILYVQVSELEPVIIENQWLCRMDMALLRTTPKLDDLQDALIQCVVGSEIPILVLRDGDSKGGELIEQMRGWLADRHIDTNRIVDLGLGVGDDLWQGSKRLVGMMPDELAIWVQDKLKALDIPVKFAPFSTDIRHEISQRFEQLLLSYLWDGMSQKLEMPRLLVDLDRELQFTQAMQIGELDQQLQDRLRQGGGNQSYGVMLEQVVGQFFEHFFEQHSSEIRMMMQKHLQQLKGG